VITKDLIIAKDLRTYSIRILPSRAVGRRECGVADESSSADVT